MEGKSVVDTQPHQSSSDPNNSMRSFNGHYRHTNTMISHPPSYPSASSISSESKKRARGVQQTKVSRKRIALSDTPLSYRADDESGLHGSRNRNGSTNPPRINQSLFLREGEDSSDEEGSGTNEKSNSYRYHTNGVNSKVPDVVPLDEENRTDSSSDEDEVENCLETDYAIMPTARWAAETQKVQIEQACACVAAVHIPARNGFHHPSPEYNLAMQRIYHAEENKKGRGDRPIPCAEAIQAKFKKIKSAYLKIKTFFNETKLVADPGTKDSDIMREAFQLHDDVKYANKHSFPLTWLAVYQTIDRFEDPSKKAFKDALKKKHETRGAVPVKESERSRRQDRVSDNVSKNTQSELNLLTNEYLKQSQSKNLTTIESMVKEFTLTEDQKKNLEYSGMVDNLMKLSTVVQGLPLSADKVTLMNKLQEKAAELIHLLF